MTTSLGDKLRAQAATLRTQAEALEIAAKVMDALGTSEKQRTAERAYSQAAEMRASQRDNGNGAAPSQQRVLTQQERHTLLREAMEEGPRSSAELHQVFEQHGIHLTKSRIAQILGTMEGLRKVGKGNMTRWMLHRRPEA